MSQPSPLARPWSNTYWLPGGQVLCGEYPGDKNPAAAAKKAKALARFGVSTYIDLTTPVDGLKPYSPVAGVVHRFPVTDLGVPDRELMAQILDAIDDAVARERTVYIHCWGGVGRTGTVAGCWLRRHGAGPDEALAIIAERWKTVEKFHRMPHSPETSEQRHYVREWDEWSLTRKSFPVLDRERRYRGALLGGAVGDALGAPVEFMKIDAIRRQYGKEGITDFVSGDWPAGSITDDTQMTLFTAEAMLRYESRGRDRGISSHKDVGYHAYRRWLSTQGGRVTIDPRWRGWLVDRKELHQRRAPGTTCLEALSVRETNPDYTNDRKGCGGVMRAAPCGLFQQVPPEEAFVLGSDLAHVTHHHPEGYVSAGVLAALIANLRDGVALTVAARRALGIALLHRHEAPRTAALLEQAITLVASDAPRTAASAESLGQGWIAEEALAIAVYSALAADDDFAAGVRLAVNHSGDSDSTGAICGNILGTALGVDAIPPAWLAQLEAREVIVQIADDLATGWREGEDWMERYPPN